VGCPFGLRNAPALFAELIHLVTHQHAAYLIAFLDDILIYSSSVDLHLKHLKGVMDSFRESYLRLHVTKSHWASDSVRFLGHRLKAGTISIDKDKLDAVASFPRPETTKQVEAFLGLCSFWRSHIKNFSQKSSKMRALLQKGEKFYWNQEHEKEFKDLKETLCSAPVLRIPHLNRPFILYSDASVTGIGSTLAQLDPITKKPFVCEYYGKALTKSQRDGL
jgi:hypothetical protein